ncbi:hypothetical protein, partial [Rhodoplanes roseus]|uniref:hypothetical protein n=1 Tax=Rhodoplanes roseus TaxID=29409 RepID=UPI001AECDE46
AVRAAAQARPWGRGASARENAAGKRRIARSNYERRSHPTSRRATDVGPPGGRDNGRGIS